MTKAGKRQAILTAAKELLLEVGYESMSPNKVLERSGAGQGSLYHHFSGKKQLAQTVLYQVAEDLKADLLSIFTNNDLTPVEKLDHYLARPRHGLKGCKLGRLSNEKAFADDDLRQPLQQFFKFALAEVRQQVEQAVREGLFPADTPADAIAHSVMATVQGGYVLSKSVDDDSAVNVSTAGARVLLRAYQESALLRAYQESDPSKAIQR